MTTNSTVTEITEAEALDEAVLLFFRKVRRLGFDKAWAALPDGAKHAIMMAEARADRFRNRHGFPGHNGPNWPTDNIDDEE